jgi:hypothetical protein
LDTAPKDQIGMRQANVRDDRGIRGQFLQKGLFGFSQSVGHVAADFYGLLLPGFFRTSLCQFVVLPVHAERENKKDQGREKNRAPEEKDLLEVLSVWPAGGARFHFIMVA